MKYIFNKPEKPNQFRQYSLIQDVNHDLVLKDIPPIAYDQVESYWKKMYKGKHITRTQSARPIEESAQPEVSRHMEQPHNEPAEMHI